jgi:ParB-like chromosome segregation protein Spo0J
MLTVKRVPLAELVPDPQNARTHDEKNLAAIRASLTKFGQVEPLVVRRGSNVVIGGNGRLEAMRSLEWTHAAVTWFEGTDAEARALGLALNRTAELAAWDEGRLAAALAEVKAEGLADAAGWTDDEIAAVVKEFAEVAPPELPLGYHPDETRSTYQDRVIKRIVFLFEFDEYDSVMSRLDAIMASTSCRDHTETFVRLMEEYEKGRHS